jgi:hypothetical protein
MRIELILSARPNEFCNMTVISISSRPFAKMKDGMNEQRVKGMPKRKERV